MVKEIKCAAILLFVVLVMTSCDSTQSSIDPVEQIELTQGRTWQYKATDQATWKTAVVPGTIHQDLMRDGEIPDPFVGLNEFDVQWVEDKDWEYKTEIQIDESTVRREHVELVFKGLDTYADVYLNDSLVLTADNMFRSWKVDVKGVAKPGANALRVLFHSPVKKGMEKLKRFDYLFPVQNEQAPKGEQTCVYTRKASYHYGWDWGPRLTTSGIWQAVYLRAWDEARISDTYWKIQSLDRAKATFNGVVEIASSGRSKAKLVVSLDGIQTSEKEVQLVEGLNQISIPLTIENPKLWWPAEYGEQPLYDVEVKLVMEDKEIDSHARKVAACMIKCVQKPDDDGASFYVEVNGTPIFVKGANYIPGDNLIPRVSREKYERVLDEALAAHMNGLRVWGGAIYEKDVFYDLCLEKGILLWQDFMFACSMYPANAEAKENIRLEAVEQVKRLRNYPNIYVWAGNNEIFGAWQHWNFVERFDLSPSDSAEVWNDYQVLFNDVLPKAIAKWNPDMLYIPSSPQSKDNTLENGKSGDNHYWDVWFGEKDFESYREENGRFFSEYGFQSYPAMSTLRKFAAEPDMDPFSEVLFKRQRSPMGWLRDENGEVLDTANGNVNIHRHMGRYFREPKTFEHYVYVSQLMHALAMKEAMTAHRRNKPYTMGSLYWQINDCWPTISWSSVDYFGIWKATHYEARDAYKKIIVSPVEEEGALKCYVVSDDLEEHKGVLTLVMKGFEGEELFRDQKKLTIPGNSSFVAVSYLANELKNRAKGMNTKDVYVKAVLQVEGELVDEEFFFFERTKDLELPAVDIKLLLTENQGTMGIEVSTTGFAKDVFLYHPTVGVNFSENFFTLEKGEKRVVYVMEGQKVDLEDLVSDLKVVSIKATY